MKIIGIYKITSPTNKVYIGQTRDFEYRKLTYKYKSCKGQQKLYYSINKYGWNTHQMTLIEECSLEDLNCRERYWQDYYDVLNKGLNLLLKKCEDKPHIISEITKEKIATSLKNYAQNKEDFIYQYNLDGSLKKKWKNIYDIKSNSNFDYRYITACYSKKHLLKAYEFIWTKEETTFTQDFLRIVKITKSDKLKGHKFNLGKIRTQEHKDKISKKSKGFKHKEETKKFISSSKLIPISQYDLNGDFIRNWDSAKNAGIALKIRPQSISSCCRNKLKTAGKFIWKYEKNNMLPIP